MSASTVPAISLGDRAPAFAGLRGTDGRTYSLDTFVAAQVLLLVFVGNGCPTVRLYEDRLGHLAGRFPTGVQVVLVNSNNPHLSPPDTLERMVERSAASALPFPYLKDPDGALAKACGAVCTPHAFVFDASRRLRYQGRVDDSRTGNRVTSHDLANALADLVAGRAVGVAETSPFGCAIVW